MQGFGGTNAHAIVEEYLPIPNQPTNKQPEETSTSPCLLPIVLSAKSKKSMKSTLENMIQFIDTQPDLNLNNLAYTLLEGRSVLPFRRALIGPTKESLRSALETAIEEGDTNLWTD